jgi:6-pyruvoyltetrahydropterin/6-carboxytetrahydropterin synthase
MKLTRRYRFSASHRLDTPAMSVDENRKLYGKCNNPYGHGHDYVLDVTVAGSPDESGQIVGREALDGLVEERILARFDHRNLNMDIAELKGVVPTTESLAVAIGKALEDRWPLPGRLDRVRISETERNIFELESKC